MIGKVTVTCDGQKEETKDPTLEAADLRSFLAMLDRSSVGFGQRHDYNPEGTSVQVEHPVEGSDTEFWVTDWSFDAAGKLIDVGHYKGELG